MKTKSLPYWDNDVVDRRESSPQESTLIEKAFAEPGQGGRLDKRDNPNRAIKADQDTPQSHKENPNPIRRQRNAAESMIDAYVDMTARAGASESLNDAYKGKHNKGSMTKPLVPYNAGVRY